MTATILILVALAVVTQLLVSRQRSRRRARRVYQEALARALADGVLTPEETAELDKLRSDKDLSSREVRMAALALYRTALHDAAADARLTPDEDEHLRALQTHLGLSERDLGTEFLRVSRLRMLSAITSGRLPEVPCPIDLVPDEVCHWVVHATLAHRLDLPAREALEGVPFDVLAPEPFHANGPRSELAPSELVLPTDLGVLIVTSRRTVLQGARRTLSIPHARLQRVTLYGDGVGLEEQAGVISLLLVDDAELTAAIVLHAARQRRAEIRPARSGRTA
jgi:tellurite resistance protein